jgi:hypothetical protein
MNAQEAQTLQLNEVVIWTPDGMKGQVTAKTIPASELPGKTANLATINLQICCLKSKDHPVPRIDVRVRVDRRRAALLAEQHPMQIRRSDPAEGV